MHKIACEMTQNIDEFCTHQTPPNLKFCLSSSKEKKEVACSQAMEEKSSFHPFYLTKTE